jgi:predicted transcriptional regulator
MTIELPVAVEKDLQDLAVAQSRDIRDLVEEALRQYLEAAAITDLDAGDIAAAQVQLVEELRGIEEWKA